MSATGRVDQPYRRSASISGAPSVTVNPPSDQPIGTQHANGSGGVGSERCHLASRRLSYGAGPCVARAARVTLITMNQPAGGVQPADERAAHQAVQDGAAEQVRLPGTDTQEPLEEEQRWTLYQVDQQRMAALDTNMMTIRGWTVTLASALAGFSLSQHHLSFLPIAMVGTLLLGLLDVRYRRTQLRHADRADKLEQVLPRDYRLRPDGYRSAPRWLAVIPKRYRSVPSRYRSSISFYAVVLLVLLLLWVAT
jgi:uncharacterized membrane protein